MIRQIIGLFANILAANYKYPVLNRDKLLILMQMQLSQKQKNFSEFFFPFLKSILNFEYLKKKDDAHRFYISEITDSEHMAR